MGNSKSTLNNIIHDIDLEMGSLMTSARETGLQQLIVPKDAQNLVFSDTKVDFWTPGLPEGVLSNPPCPLVRPSVRWSVRGPSVNISETIHWFFLIFCMKLEHHKGTKVTEPDF